MFPWNGTPATSLRDAETMSNEVVEQINSQLPLNHGL